jgi:hypothetical protein
LPDEVGAQVGGGGDAEDGSALAVQREHDVAGAVGVEGHGVEVQAARGSRGDGEIQVDELRKVRGVGDAQRDLPGGLGLGRGDGEVQQDGGPAQGVFAGLGTAFHGGLGQHGDLLPLHGPAARHEVGCAAVVLAVEVDAGQGVARLDAERAVRDPAVEGLGVAVADVEGAVEAVEAGAGVGRAVGRGRGEGGFAAGRGEAEGEGASGGGVGLLHHAEHDGRRAVRQVGLAHVEGEDVEAAFGEAGDLDAAAVGQEAVVVEQEAGVDGAHPRGAVGEGRRRGQQEGDEADGGQQALCHCLNITRDFT